MTIRTAAAVTALGLSSVFATGCVMQPNEPPVQQPQAAPPAQPAAAPAAAPAPGQPMPELQQQQNIQKKGVPDDSV